MLNYLPIVSLFTIIVFFVPYTSIDVWADDNFFNNTGVWIPDHEYVGFYDSNGIYNVVGALKNSEIFPIMATMTITIQDDDNIVSEKFESINVMPLKEVPFKFKFPQVSSNDPVLESAEISFIHGVHNPISLEVIYDSSLIVHPDGHLTGKFINTGEKIISNTKLVAIIHGHDDQVLDLAQNVKSITNLKPGEIRDFVMYPDPAIASDVWYYSCFAIGTDTVIVLNAQRNDETFTLRYDSGILISYPEFDDSGKELSFWLNKGWPLPEYYINFEFPRYSNDESFQVYLDDQRIESIQSLDEWMNWHVAFYLADQSDGNLVIKGFNPTSTLPVGLFIPEWIKHDAGWWSQEQISDEEFIDALEYLSDYELLQVPINYDLNDHMIPDWVRSNAGWWSQGLISNEEFVNAMQFLITNKIINLSL